MWIIVYMHGGVHKCCEVSALHWQPSLPIYWRQEHLRRYPHARKMLLGKPEMYGDFLDAQTARTTVVCCNHCPTHDSCLI